MGQAANVADLREMLRLASSMRKAASATQNERYIQMFLRAAMTLEDRATRTAHAPDNILPLEEDHRIHDAVNLLC
jgi:hypothetical protein